jgi:hypothetical protein
MQVLKWRCIFRVPMPEAKTNERARSLIRPGGEMQIKAFTVTELHEATSGGIEVDGRLFLWEDMTDRQVERLAAGEVPGKVLL